MDIPRLCYNFSNSVVGHFWVHSDFGRTSAEINILKVVWSAVIFRIRKQERNQCIYTQHVADWKTMVQDIIFLSWSSSSFKVLFCAVTQQRGSMSIKLLGMLIGLRLFIGGFYN